MSKFITPTTRPIIAYEHPTFQMHAEIFREHLVRQIKKRPRLSQYDEFIKNVFSRNDQDLKEQCDILLRYFTEAFVHYSAWDYTHAYYPGRPSQQNARTDALEGCSRFLPLLASWLSQQGEPEPILYGLSGKSFDAVEIIKKALLSGTDRNHPGYWGTLGNYDQRVCESADLALTLWLSRNWVWNHFDSRQKKQVVDWFSQVNQCKTVDNNWHLFPLTVQIVLRNLTGDNHVQLDRYQRLKEFYVGNGWFRDGAKGNYDYYNAWGFHYSLFWIDQIDPDFDSCFIQQAVREFNENYRFFFSSHGVPFFGRSVCYRLAAPAPLLSALQYSESGVSVQQAKRIFSNCLKTFISNGALRYGLPTQGLYGADARLTDNYSGPASSLWSLRALIVAFYNGQQTGLWTTSEGKLEVECSDFSFHIESIDAKVQGCQRTQEVTVTFQYEYIDQQSPFSRTLKTQSWLDLAKERITGRANRPKNNLLRQGVTSYSSKMTGFF
ncbi:DUF2264 domain-containing protein [Vibrio hangzhouensis]|uniref:DUF2264 domain-containing protein n=1 Tax=Vibrio hangzhouensis TaxID=462991 RepID=A0A1H6B916_9VIBR|nr:DUF2264 domain-containing protein [Vibrio hangzhouensis]SEG57120.1 hypothetical protein SAMN04488244_12044 [Vibrio hangzhouensis]